jgi:hypothetical protein
VFRLLSCVYVLGFQIAINSDLRRPTLGWVLFGVLALTAAATAKLFLFDLATLDRIFPVAAFIVVGLVLLSMGAGYARSLAQQGPR